MAFAVLALMGTAAVAVPAAAQDRGKVSIGVASVIQVQSASSSALPIRVGPSGLVPRQAFVRVRGLPPTVALSEGHSIAVGAWAVPLTALPRLRMEIPAGAEGKSEIAVLLVSAEGVILDEARATLVIVANRAAADAPAPGPAAPRASAAHIEPQEQRQPALRPRLAAADRDRALKMLQRGNDLIASKDFSAAQHFFKRAAEIGLAEAALALARTYDPGEIARIGAVGLMPDPETARTWYEKAKMLGAAEAEEHLQRLGGVR